MASQAEVAAACDVCGRTIRPGGGFVQRSPSGGTLKCFLHAMTHWPMLRRSLIVAAIIGSWLMALNHGDVLFVGGWAAPLAWKIPLTYLTPFLVATFGAMGNARR